MNDILHNIDNFINRVEGNTYIPKDKVLKIIDILKEECCDDAVLLENSRIVFEKYWNKNNLELITNFYETLEYYNIIKGKRDILKNKSLLENKNNTVIRKQFVSKNRDRILGLLNNEE